MSQVHPGSHEHRSITIPIAFEAIKLHVRYVTVAGATHVEGLPSAFVSEVRLGTDVFENGFSLEFNNSKHAFRAKIVSTILWIGTAGLNFLDRNRK